MSPNTSPLIISIPMGAQAVVVLDEPEIWGYLNLEVTYRHDGILHCLVIFS